MEQGYDAVPQYEDRDGKYNLHFSQQSVRAGFVRKVFFLVTVMFGITSAFCVVPMVSEPFRNWVYNNFWMCLIPLMVLIVVSALMCCGNLRRQFPINIILLTTFTLSAATVTMFITACFHAQTVLICTCITTICSGAVIAFSHNTKSDLTSLIGVAFMLSMVLFSFGLFAMIFTLGFEWELLNSVYSGLVALFMMLYLAIDVQLLMGDRTFQLSPEDYKLCFVARVGRKREIDERLALWSIDYGTDGWVGYVDESGVRFVYGTTNRVFAEMKRISGRAKGKQEPFQSCPPPMSTPWLHHQTVQRVNLHHQGQEVPSEKTCEKKAIIENMQNIAHGQRYAYICTYKA
uniref:Uncharacterized protein n=1 Tax=Caenorhabditis japonica TaxID=281687 RepID=A0A8R1I138_CAEJA